MQCECCGNSHDEDNMNYVDSYGYVCDNCSFFCNYCDEWHINDNLVEVRNSRGRLQEICAGCAENGDFRTCDHCGDLVHVDWSYYIDSTDMTACDTCHDDLYTMCKECHESVLDEDIDSETGYCQSCQESYELEQASNDDDTVNSCE
jgi:hypothetical protein